ncbi:hypothetical protein QUB36_14915 [Microcoleus sp. AT8-B1]
MLGVITIATTKKSIASLLLIKPMIESVRLYYSTSGCYEVQ